MNVILLFPWQRAALMTLSTPVIAVLAIVFVVGILKAVFSGRRLTGNLSYVRADLFNTSEHAFLLALRREAPTHIAVLAKVRVADLIQPARQDISAFNRIARKHVDFVLYHTQSRQVLLAIELDGPTHSSKRSQESDNLKNSCFASARLRLVRVPVAGSDRIETVRALFQSLDTATATTPSTTSAPGLTKQERVKPTKVSSIRSRDARLGSDSPLAAQDLLAAQQVSDKRQ